VENTRIGDLEVGSVDHDENLDVDGRFYVQNWVLQIGNGQVKLGAKMGRMDQDKTVAPRARGGRQGRRLVYYVF
jgi:hypothetical protein